MQNDKKYPESGYPDRLKVSKTSPEEDFKGKPGQSTVLKLHGIGFKRQSLVGIGPCTPLVTIAYKVIVHELLK
ncbi:hypothetical protein KSP40_PGU019116 [Platanthera guangdongensis]|uniref:Uncharacterized protein n=1 Tax=Platanthera guangdongensis TaxID=2320717 RepID=A0ABR2MVB2_9ASPA